LEFTLNPKEEEEEKEKRQLTYNFNIFVYFSDAKNIKFIGVVDKNSSHSETFTARCYGERGITRRRPPVRLSVRLLR